MTRDSLWVPSGCTPRGLATFVDGFFDAFNRGEWEKVDPLFAPDGSRPEDFKL